MPTNSPITVKVSYRFVKGLHGFTSDDVYGLFVLDQDPERAFHAVCPSIKELLRLNLGMDVEVEPAVSLQEFLGASKQVPQTVLSSRSFVLRAAA